MYTQEEINKICTENNVKLLSKFKKISDKYDFTCTKCSTNFNKTLEKAIYRKSWCPNCNIDKIVRQKLENIAKINGGSTALH